jgi:hypothetical protein
MYLLDFILSMADIEGLDFIIRMVGMDFLDSIMHLADIDTNSTNANNLAASGRHWKASAWSSGAYAIFYDQTQSY